MAEFVKPLDVLERRKTNGDMGDNLSLMIDVLRGFEKELKAQRERMDQTMETHAKLFEEKVQALDRVLQELRHFVTVPLFNRIEKLERPGKTNNSMREDDGN